MQPELRYRRVWFLAGLAIAGTIAVACLLPAHELPKTGLSDKLEHVLAFAVLAFWFGSILVRRDLAWLALSLVAFGAVIELGQATMGWGRHADARDVVADTAGVAAGLLLALTPLGGWTRWFEARLLRGRP